MDHGHFFGEIAIIRKGRRTSTVRALETVKLLVLDRHDFTILMDQNPIIAQRINDIANSRMSAQPIEPESDIDRREVPPDGPAAPIARPQL